MQTKLTTLCYLEKNDSYLMLHRVKKKIDVNKGKWIGTGGKFEYGESPEECLIREVREETGFTLKGFRYRGLICFVYADKDPEYIFVYTSTEFETAVPPLTQKDRRDKSADYDTEAEAGADVTGGVCDPDSAELPVPECDEGIFAWVRKDRILKDLELWEGDRYMLEYLLKDRQKTFSLKLCYDEEDRLTEAWEMAVSPVRLK